MLLLDIVNWEWRGGWRTRKRERREDEEKRRDVRRRPGQFGVGEDGPDADLLALNVHPPLHSVKASENPACSGINHSPRSPRSHRDSIPCLF